MFVSFVVPVYNVEKYIKQCIDSLLIQTGAEFEIVLLDDGSTDRSGLICDQYAVTYPDIVRVVHKENEGSLLTRCRGFQEAKGDWFICVDSDDTIAPNLLSSVEETIEEYGCDMVMYNFDYINDDGVHSPSRLNIADKTEYTGETKQFLYEKRLLSVDFNSMCMRAVRRDIVDLDVDYSKYGIRNMCDDALHCLALYTNTKRTVYLAEPLYHYRKGHASTTAKASFENWKSTYICCCVTETYLGVWGVSMEVKTRYYTRLCESIANFSRWLVDENDEELVRKTVERIKEDNLFKRCSDNLDKRFISTKYMRIIVPIIIRFIQTGNVAGLKLLIKTERKILAARQ